ncbi:MAG: 23S rRNA (pseudouridine(1915)-N(3))-methyltransferase RlmH [Verrucomicrobiota bacterium]|nr:23S rRNA (pseudouridine(1915)-N(3))-methyltransferase RlmH [Verrucomicrobiota bacterium]
MMQFEILAVGKLREPWLKDAVDEYLKRLTRFSKTSLQETNEQSVDESKSVDSQIIHATRNEAQVLLMKINPAAHVISLDLKGRGMTSPQFAEFLETQTIQGTSKFQFIIGGSHGLDESVLNQSHTRLSLSAMTFPHQLSRVILLEQIYRACKIIHGETYHK